MSGFFLNEQCSKQLSWEFNTIYLCFTRLKSRFARHFPVGFGHFVFQPQKLETCIPPNGKGKAGETSTAFPQGPPSSWGPLHVWVLPYCLGDSEIFEAVKKMVGMTMVTAGTMGKHMYQNMVVMDRNAGICFLVVLLQWDNFIDMMSETVQNKTVLPQATKIQVCRKNIVTSQPHAWYINIYI